MSNEEYIQAKFAELLEKEGYKMSMTDPGGNVIDGPREIMRYLWKKFIEWLRSIL